MAKTILVPVNSKNTTAVPLRRLETVVAPGDRIIFLAPYGCGTLDRLSAHISLMQTGLEAAVVCEERKARLLWNEERTRLEHFVIPARRLFERLGAEVVVSLYSGSLNRLIKRYQGTGEVLLILSVSPWSRWLKIFRTSAGKWFTLRWSRYSEDLPAVSGRSSR
jgi:hypothetical protein